MKRGRLATSRDSGFSFAELLVGLSLGAILLATILPALNTASDSMKAAVCLGNMHQWGVAIGLYTADQRDYYPYDGGVGNPCDSWAWYNVLPPYLSQPKLCDLYSANTPPKPGMKSIWICPSGTNTTVSPTIANPYFMYAFSACTHEVGNTHNIFRRSRMIKPATTLIFCEEPEDNFPDATGQYIGARHFGGNNFVFGDGHCEWLTFQNYCRANNQEGPAPCSGFNGTIPALASGTGLGEWNPQVTYHWWFFPGAATSPN